jgi:AcrR family transcriptional regulator
MADPRSPTSREVRKSQTRSALRNAALQLFAAQGYDATLTEEISEMAGVSSRTFFRYFPTKESVLFADKDLWFESLAEVYCRQTLPNDVDAMCAALVELAPGLARSREMLRLYKRSVATSLTLQGLRLDHQEHNSKDLAAAIATRRGLESADEACNLLGAIGVMAHRKALNTWLSGPDDVELGAVIAETFRLLKSSFRQGTSSPAKRKRALPTQPARTLSPDNMDDEQQIIALEEIRFRQAPTAGRRERLVEVTRIRGQTRMKSTDDAPPTK